MLYPNKYETWTVSLITPLHIGTGDTLEKGIDFIQEKGRLQVIDPEQTFAQLADNPSALKESGTAGFNWNEFSRQYRIQPVESYSMTVNGTGTPQTIRRFIKDAFDRPYLPGSSLKGSLRTVFLTRMAAQSNQRAFLKDSKKWADQYLDNLAGATPHKDFLRGLHISDTVSLNHSESGICTREIKFLNLISPDKARWKSIPQKKNLDDFRNAAGVFVETLEPETILMASMSIDGYLADPRKRQEAGLPFFNPAFDFDETCKMIREHSQNIARQEKEFFSRYSPEGRGAARFYQDLLKQIESIPPGKGFIARIAWGSGWLGMTGNWLSRDLLRRARQKFRMGRDNMPFPKTRRLALDKEGSPSVPLGWIKVTRHADRSFQTAAEKPARQTSSKPVSEIETRAVSAPGLQQQAARSPEEIKADILKEFQSIVGQAGSGLSGSIDEYINRIKIQEDEELKGLMSDYLLKAAKGLGKAYKNARKNNKQWIQKLDAIVKETGKR